jgi:hypothetical protein
MYTPHPIDTSSISLPSEIESLVEQLAEHVHDKWAQERIVQGWSYGPARDDEKRQHPSIVPYCELPDEEKVFDRVTAIEALKAVLALGWKISKSDPD